MAVTYLGVRHHSPACARLVADTITAVRPAYVLVEGPADMNGRIGELLLGHELPIAVYTGYRDGRRRHASWAPLCAYSPEWTALTAGREVGAQLRFIDLPAWDPALAGLRNRYADAETRYSAATERLCREFAVDNIDALWDHLFEIAPAEGLAERLDVYFDAVRGETEAGPDDTARERYMAHWVRAAAADAGDRPVVVVTGGFHRPALIRLAQHGDRDWPEVPQPPGDAVVGSYLVPYSFRRLDAFDGYQSGMPSPAYYQQLWESGPVEAAARLTGAVATRLRGRRQPVSTADLIAARVTGQALAALRGHPVPSRVDVLDGLAAALVGEALEVPLPWATRGHLRPGSHPVVVEMVASLSGDLVGVLHPDTPLPPLVHAARRQLADLGLDGSGEIGIDLGDDTDRQRSRLLHRLRVLAVPGVERAAGPGPGQVPLLRERWLLEPSDDRLPALIEAGSYGGDPLDAAAAVLAERIAAAGGDMPVMAALLFDAVLCGAGELAGPLLDELDAAVASAADLGGLGQALGVVLAMWRHDGVFDTAGSVTLGTVVAAATRRALWLIEGVRGGAAPADRARIHAVTGVRDALRHAGGQLGLDLPAALGVADRVAADRDAPADLRGAVFGLGWSLRGSATDAGRAMRGAFTPAGAGDWLAGLFALAREEVLHAEGMVELLDELVGGLGEAQFLIALPALRQAFAWFPPRERHQIAVRVLRARTGGTGPDLLRLDAAPGLVAAGMALDERVDAALRREGLITT
ncbi:hypothetical protein Cme02nite_04220 [Catellatospora methionotrophica]|uniref:Uncharacterized protein n=1 Tax=Catellatospora methionotrophica TaxID=121620 RepID=A0A8J3LG85_9ACTN|nr:DUF5682 family protein [Catellatospora methionotrophica]GIG12090.1 hypothetical protein Cme02nite_04220 [Catellatospora methionotrophica]